MRHLGFIAKIRLPLILLLALMVPLVVESWISHEIKSFFYSLSLSIKTLLVFILPFIVFSFIVTCIARMGKNAFLFTLVLIATVFLSNITAIFTGYMIGSVVMPFLSIPVASENLGVHALVPLWTLELPPLFTNMNALIAGFFAGMVINIFNAKPLKDIAFKSSDIASAFLKHVFIPILPLFILGFAFKLHADGILSQAITSYGPILLLVIASQASYLFMYFFIASRFVISKCWTYIGNTLPVALTGLSTVSSAATMPVLIDCTEKNIADPSMARTIIPAVINIHTVGGAIGLTILSLVTLHTFDLPLPNLSSFTVFALCYALAKFSVAAVPGGVILVVVPILQSEMGFSDDMLGLITAVYMIFDPFGTAMNVSGNSAFAIVFNRICCFLGFNKTLAENTSEQCSEKALIEDM